MLCEDNLDPLGHRVWGGSSGVAMCLRVGVYESQP